MKQSPHALNRLSRRTFLKGAAGVGLAPLIIPSSSFGATAPSNQITVGVIGMGGRGRWHLTEYLRHKDRARVVAVCEVDTKRREGAKATVNRMHEDTACAAYEDYRELLARDDIDAVTIAVPDHWHAIIAVAAARAGKAIYSEKPFAYTVAEGRAIVDAVHRYGVVFQHGTQQRSGKDFRHACELARNGRLGELKTVRVGSPFGKRGGEKEPAPVPEGLNYEFWLGPAPHKPYTPGRCDGHSGNGWYHIRDYSGGWITAWGAHDVDIAHWGMGVDDTGPLTVAGEGEVDTTGVYDTLWRWRIECMYKNGVKVIYGSEDENPHGVKFEGTEGWVFVNRGKIEAEPASLLTAEFGADDTRLVKSDSHTGNFLDAIRDGAELAAPIEAAHRSTTTCHLCNIAVQLGREIQWNPDKEYFDNDQEATRLLSRAMREPWHI
jgi:predicted dehydrogenase